MFGYSNLVLQTLGFQVPCYLEFLKKTHSTLLFSKNKSTPRIFFLTNASYAALACLISCTTISKHTPNVQSCIVYIHLVDLKGKLLTENHQIRHCFYIYCKIVKYSVFSQSMLFYFPCIKNYGLEILYHPNIP